MNGGLLWNVVIVGAFILLVVVPVALRIDELPDRVRSVRRGIRGVLYTPIALGVLVSTALAAYAVSRHLRFLQWGWLGTNIVAAPMIAVAGKSGNGSFIILVGITALLLPVFLLFNYVEEREYRDSWRDVGIWAASHLIMGIPLFAVFPIFATGVVYKVVHDRQGLEPAYVAHITTNCSLLVLVLLTATM